MREKSKDTVLTPKERHDTIIEKGGVKCMTKETERFTLRLTKELKWKLDESRKRMGISLNALVVQILWNWTECKDDEERKGESKTIRQKVSVEREQVTIRLPVELREKIQGKADKEGQSFNTELILLIRKVLEEG